MRFGLIGLQNSGKTTIFNALTNSEAETNPYPSMKAEPNISVIDVIDERINVLTEMYNPKKTIFAQIEYIDFVGLSEDAASSGAFSGNAMSEIKRTDALGIVLRNFNDEVISSTLGEPSPVKDAENLISELILSDLIIAEKRLEKIELGYKRGIKTAAVQVEEKILKRIIEKLNENIPVLKAELTDEEQKIIRGFQFLTDKPILLILNSDENNFGENAEVMAELAQIDKVIEFCGKFEMDLNSLSEEDAEMFMEDMGITESARNRLTTESYSLLGYISFFTVGSDEVRAWTITNGDNAVEAAGKIHSDLARGFIRAECFNYANLVEHGSEKVLKEKGLFQLEGKEYIVKDGDILSIRFNV